MHERTRKFWVIILFLLLGPVVTVLLVSSLIHRRTGSAARELEAQLVSFLKRPISIQKIRFVRPEITDYFGIRFKSSNERETILFCPELYTEKRTVPPARKELLTMFPDQKRFKPEEENTTEINSVLSPLPPTEQTKTEQGKNAQGKTGQDKGVLATESSDSTFIDHVPESAQNIQIWKIPLLYIRYSKIEEFRDWFFTWLQKQDIARDELVFFDIGQIHIMYSDVDFNEIMHQHSEELSKRNMSKNKSSSKEQETRDSSWIQEGVDAAPEVVQRWVIQYNGQLTSAVLSGLQGMFYDQKGKRRVDFSFVFEGIPCTFPVNVSVEHQEKSLHEAKTEARTRFVLNTNDGPFPTTFASFFDSFFYLTGQKSWFTGLITGDFTLPQKETPAKSVWQLDKFHLRGSDIEPFAKRSTPTQITGTIVDLFLERALIKDGVFSAVGSLYLTKGTLEKTFLIKLQDQFHLKFEPANTLSNRFEKNAVPYDELFFQFRMLPQGMEFDSSYPRRIIGCCQRDSFQYGLYLPNNATDRMAPYPILLKLITTEEGTAPFWSRFYKEAINHLPVENIPLEMINKKQNTL